MWKKNLYKKNKIEKVSKKPDPVSPPVTQSTSGVKLASPKVRKFARELGTNVAQIQGSQRSGRVTEDDVKKFVKSQVSVNQGKVEPKKYKDEYSHEEFGEIEIKDMPRVKKLSGPQLVRSWTEIPHVTQHDEIDITEMEQFRTSLFDHFTGEKISVTPLAFITRAVVNALKDFPNFNCSIDPEQNKIFYKKYYHVGFAVDTPHGLMVPKLRDVDQMNIKEIGDELRRVSRDCRDLKINKKEFFGGSMTISSLGGIGGTFFTPIINPPEVAILGVGKSFDTISLILFFWTGFSFTSIFDSTFTVSIRSPSLTLSHILILIFSIIPSFVEGTSTLDLSLSIVIRESFFFIVCPALTKTSMTSTSLKSPMFGTKISLEDIL